MTVLKGTPTVLNFTLSKEVFNEQGNRDLDYPQVSLFNQFAPYEIIDYEYPDL